MDVQLTTEPIEYTALVEGMRDPQSGAVVLFLGTVRELSEGKRVSALEYEAFPTMAEKKLAEIVAEAQSRWSIQRAGVIHRHGRMELGDVAVAVATASAHRADAFESARWIMDTIKQVVPIWKREIWADGAPPTWVHPAAAEPGGSNS